MIIIVLDLEKLTFRGKYYICTVFMLFAMSIGNPTSDDMNMTLYHPLPTGIFCESQAVRSGRNKRPSKGKYCKPRSKQ